MDFRLSPEQAMFQNSIRRTLADLGRRSGPDIRRVLADLGVFAVPFPQEVGGLGGGPVETMLVMGEFGRALVDEPFLSCALLAGTLLTRLGVGRDLIGGLVDGTSLTVLAAIEHRARGDIGYVSTTASRVTDGFVLDGRKSVVVGAPDAACFLVTARSPDGAFPGIGLFRVAAASLPGLVPYRTIDGSPAADLVFDRLVVPQDALIACDCADALSAAVDEAIMASCAEAVAAMEAAFWLTNDYLKTRRQFSVAIGSFQALQHRMADRYVDLEQARSMLYRGIAALGAPAGERSAMVSAAKAYIGRIGKQLSADMIQLHGGIGVTEEHTIGHYYRRLLAIDARFGNSDHHLRRFAGLG